MEFCKKTQNNSEWGNDFLILKQNIERKTFANLEYSELSQKEVKKFAVIFSLEEVLTGNNPDETWNLLSTSSSLLLH